MYKAMDIALFILEYCRKKGYKVGSTRLQKILYFAQIAYLVVEKTPLFKEKITAWKEGPTIPDVYYKVEDPATETKPSEHIFRVDKTFLMDLVDKCLSISEDVLNRIILKQRPWIEANQDREDIEITLDSLVDYAKNPGTDLDFLMLSEVKSYA